MTTTARQDKTIAVLQTAGICIAIELTLVLLFGTYVDSYLGALIVLVVFLGPVSLWLAPPLYRRLLRARGKAGAGA